MSLIIKVININPTFVYYSMNPVFMKTYPYTKVSIRWNLDRILNKLQS